MSETISARLEPVLELPATAEPVAAGDGAPSPASIVMAPPPPAVSGQLEAPRDPEPIEIPRARPEAAREPARPAPDRFSPPGYGHSSEQLARIEDKTSRIEEKYARSEAAMQRVVDRFDLASARMSEVALQSDLAALRGEVAGLARRLRAVPGVGALLMTAVVSAVLTAILVVAAMRYAPTLLAR